MVFSMHNFNQQQTEMHKIKYLKCSLADLVSKEIVEKWIKYLRNEFPTVAFKSSTQQQNKNLVSSSNSLALLFH